MYLTLSISATAIRLLSVEGRNVQKWGDSPLSPALVRDGLILDPKAVGAAIDVLFKSMKVPKEEVIASLTSLSFTYRTVNLPRMKSPLIEEAILRAARKEIPVPLEELYLSWQAIGSKDGELDFFVLGVPRKPIDAMVQTLEEAGIERYIIDLKPLALARAANRGDALIVALESDCFDIVLVANGIPAIMHTMTPRGEGARIEETIRRLTDDLSKTVTYYNGGHPKNPLSPTTPLLLTGELSSDTTANLIGAGIEYPIEQLAPLLKFPPDLPVALYVANMGLALKKVSQKTVSGKDTTRFCDINLDILLRRNGARARPLLLRHIPLILALLAGICLVLLMYQVNGRARAETVRLRTESSGVSQELRQARLALDEAKRIEDSIYEIVAAGESLKQQREDILTKEPNLSDDLKFVTSALPPAAHFTSVKMDTDQITVTGETESSFKVVDYAMDLEEQGSFYEVRIGEIGEGKSPNAGSAATDSTGVFFTIVIRK